MPPLHVNSLIPAAAVLLATFGTSHATRPHNRRRLNTGSHCDSDPHLKGLRMHRIAVFLILFLCSNAALAFDPRTHLWVAQQVLNDVVPDGTLSIDGKEYEIDPHTVAALRKHPEIFRMGNIGPDAHPDLIVGQVFLHPGSAAGWGADDWAKWLDTTASSDGGLEARAYVAGYWCHMAGDVLMHSYINTYAGDYFVLTDEQEVELRHFALEHYIGDRTPPLKDHDGQQVEIFDLGVPKKFLARTLILNDTAADQYIKYPGYAPHLLALYRLHKSVHDMRVLVEKFQAPAESRLADLDRLRKEALDNVDALGARIAMETLSLQPLIASVDILRKAVDLQEALNRPIEEAASTAEKAVIAASREVSRLEAEMEDSTRRQLVEIPAAISNAELSINTFTTQIQNWSKEIEDQTVNVSKLSGWKNTAQREVDSLASELDGFLGRWVPGYKKVKDKLNGARTTLDKLSEQLAKAEMNVRNAADNLALVRSQLDAEKEKLSKWVAEKASVENVIEQLRHAGDVARDVLQQANDEVGNVSEGLAAARHALAEKVKPFDEARHKLDGLRDLLQKLEEEKNRAIEQVRDFTAEIHSLADLTDGLFTGGVSDILQNWENDIVSATEAYIEASSQALLATMRGENPLTPIQDWFVCWAPVFTGIPGEIAQVGCKAQAYARELSEKMTTLAEELAMKTPLVRDLYSEYSKLKEIMFEQLIDASIDIADHVFGEAFTKFYTLHAREWTDQDLQNVFSSDSSGKQLLIIEDIVKRVRKDLWPDEPTDTFVPETFVPSTHAVTLAKLTLLKIDGIDKLTANYGVTEESLYASESPDPMRRNYLYPNQAGFVNILYRAVRSIDGNQQWRGVGLPYLRRNEASENTERNKFGYCRSDDPYNGFRLWTDSAYRTKVFGKLFPGELKIKSLAPGLTDLIPDSLQNCEDSLLACQLCSPDTGSISTVPTAPSAPAIRTAEEREAIKKQRALQIVDVPYVRLIERIDGKSQQQVEDAIREDTRVKLATEIRDEILNELRHSQRWGESYDLSFREAVKKSKPLLVIVRTATPSGDFVFDKLIADGLQAKLLDSFVVCKINLDAEAAQQLLRNRAGTTLPIAFLIDARTRRIVQSYEGVTTELAWGEVLVGSAKAIGIR